MVQENLVIRGGVEYQPVYKDLNFRLKLDIGGANIRIEDKLIRQDDRFYVNPEGGLDMDFNITKTHDNSVNQSNIIIWNLSDSTYNKIQESAEAFELYGAFSDDEYSLLFRGYPLKLLKKNKQTLLTSNNGFMSQDANANRRGQSDYETVLTLIDGKAQIEEAQINKEYKARVSSEIIIKDCIETFGIPVGSIEEIEHIYLNNYTARGKTSNVLNYFSRRLGFKWTITNGVFYLFSSTAPKAKYGILLNGNNSSTPQRQDDKFKTHTKTIVRASKKKGIAGVKKTTIEKIKKGFMIETQLLPFLLPGTTCFCNFGILKGSSFIYKVNHIGNNYGTECTTRVFVI